MRFLLTRPSLLSRRHNVVGGLDRRPTLNARSRGRRVRAPYLEPPERRALLAALDFTAGLGEQLLASALDFRTPGIFIHRNQVLAALESGLQVSTTPEKRKHLRHPFRGFGTMRQTIMTALLVTLATGGHARLSHGGIILAEPGTGGISLSLSPLNPTDSPISQGVTGAVQLILPQTTLTLDGFTATASGEINPVSTGEQAGLSPQGELTVVGPGSGESIGSGGTAALNYSTRGAEILATGVGLGVITASMSYELTGTLAPGAQLYVYMNGQFFDPFTGGYYAGFSNGQTSTTPGAFDLTYSDQQPIGYPGLGINTDPTFTLTVALENSAAGGTSTVYIDPGLSASLPSSVPEPGSLTLACLGVVLLLFFQSNFRGR
jgi:hypothetical protein